MLLDCTMIGPDRRFYFEVPSITDAADFYAAILGAQEVFRETSPNGAPIRVGMNIGTVGIALATQLDGEAGANRMTLSRVAAEFETPFVGLIIYVDDPDAAERRALEAGAQRHPDAVMAQPRYRDQAVRVVIDPFGNAWAFAASQPR